jgi:hypothetical protein
MHHAFLKCFLALAFLVNTNIFAQESSCLKNYRNQILEKGTIKVQNGTHEQVIIRFNAQNVCLYGTVDVHQGHVSTIQWVDDTGVLQILKTNFKPFAIQNAEAHIACTNGQTLTLIFTDAINP